GTGQWTVVSGSGNFQDASNGQTTVNNLGTGTNVFQWTISNSGCPASSEQLTIIRDEMPTTSNAGTDFIICTGSTTNLTGNTPTVGTGEWSVISGTGTIGNVTNPSTDVSN